MGRTSQQSRSGTIEFVTPRNGAFGASDIADFVGLDGQQAAEFGDEPPRSTWLMAVAAVVVTALIGVGIIAAAPWGNAPDAAPTTTFATTPDASNAPEPTAMTTVTTERSNDDRDGFDDGFDESSVLTTPVGFLLANPGDLELGGVHSVSSSPTDLREVDLWMSPGATRAAGRWLAISPMPGEVSGRGMFADAVRIDVSDHPALYATSSDNVFTMWFTAIDGVSFEMTGFGFGLDEAIRIATTVAGDPVIAGGIDYGDLAEASGPLESLARTSSAVPNWGSLSRGTLEMAESLTTYYDWRRERFVAVGATVQSAADEALSQLLISPWASAIADGLETTTTVIAGFDGTQRRVTLGSMPELGVAGIAQWTHDGRLISVLASDATPSELLGLVSDVRSADPEEWSDLAIRSARGDLEPAPSGGDETITPPTIIGRGAFVTGGMWDVTVSPGRMELSAGGDYRVVSPPDDVQPMIRRFTSTEATIVVASAGLGLAEGGKLRLRFAPPDIDGQPGEPIEAVERTMLETEAGLHMAASGFSEPSASAVAEIIDAQGIVIATLNL